MAEAIADTGPILHLHEIGRSGLLAIFDRLLIPSLVGQEMERYGITLADLADQVVCEIIPVALQERDSVLSEPISPMIQLADAEVLALARRERYAPTILTDDLSLRKRLEREGDVVTGSVGIMVRAYRKTLIRREDLETAIESLVSESSLHMGKPFKSYLRMLLSDLK